MNKGEKRIKSNSKNNTPAPKVFRPNIDTIGKNQELIYDSTAYKSFNQLKTKRPAMTFDIIDDVLGFTKDQKETVFPLSMCLVSGSQSDTPEDNKLSIFEVTKIHETTFDDTDNSDHSDDTDNSKREDAIIREVNFSHPGVINRIKAMPQRRQIVASWSEDSNVYLWDISKLLKPFTKGKEFKDGLCELSKRPTPIGIVTAHKREGFALDWNKIEEGKFLTSDTRGTILLNQLENGLKFSGMECGRHEKSVEDLQWDPDNKDVFASCSVDRSIALWDLRTPNHSPMHSAKNLHSNDINVISWNIIDKRLIASGSDDGSFKVWDIRFFREESAVAFYKWHRNPISTLEWSPLDETVIAVGSEDDTVSLWDLSLEEDMNGMIEGASMQQKIPAQLMFVHMGHKEVKELHFNGRVPGMVVTTALEGFDFFIPENLH